MDAVGAARLLDLLAAGGGIVAAVGAGGKKSTLYRLAEAHRLLGSGPHRPDLHGDDGAAAAQPGRPTPGRRRPRSWRAQVPGSPRRAIGCSPTPSRRAKPGRLGGLPGELIERLHAEGGFTVTLVKADGARMRWIKAPRDDEPVLPEGVATLLPVVSIKALGQPLEPAIGHRIERVVAVTGAAPGEPLEAQPPRPPAGERAGRAAARRRGRGGAGHQHGRRRGCRAARARSPAWRWRRARRFERVVLTSMIAADPLVEVIGR